MKTMRMMGMKTMRETKWAMRIAMERRTMKTKRKSWKNESRLGYFNVLRTQPPNDLFEPPTLSLSSLKENAEDCRSR